MIQNFKALRLLPQFGLTIYLVKLDNGKSMYCLVPDDVILNDFNFKDYRISNSLFEWFVFIDFPNYEEK